MIIVTVIFVVIFISNGKGYDLILYKVIIMTLPLVGESKIEGMQYSLSLFYRLVKMLSFIREISQNWSGDNDLTHHAWNSWCCLHVRCYLAISKEIRYERDEHKNDKVVSSSWK